MALKLNPLASQPYKLASSARLPISTFRSPKFLCLASSSSPALSSSTKIEEVVCWKGFEKS
ncbi:hypothetical protein IGI04_041486 [Brassica rapa subsp. trilocularis]|uniref:Uncharacterized protein n=2 Tax=Brassica campestris TaxID=3711 RepID=A0A8D9LS20_BRACM|nr:hypothetical protein IGI04_041486 [Brassica rapa subsp. trilocularis]CAF2374901.1 unnamed protein product [Brassica napus]CAG7884485.1 unnamed protein product [Brassica rapa]